MNLYRTNVDTINSMSYIQVVSFCRKQMIQSNKRVYINSKKHLTTIVKSVFPQIRQFYSYWRVLLLLRWSDDTLLGCFFIIIPIYFCNVLYNWVGTFSKVVAELLTFRARSSISIGWLACTTALVSWFASHLR